MQVDWMEQARCAEPEYRDLGWVTEKRSNQSRAEISGRVKKLTEICNACPVMAECYEYAEKLHPTLGFWGGKNYNYRFAVER